MEDDNKKKKKEQFKCMKCNKQYTRSNDLKRHSCKSKGKKLFYCLL